MQGVTAPTGMTSCTITYNTAADTYTIAAVSKTGKNFGYDGKQITGS